MSTKAPRVSQLVVMADRLQIDPVQLNDVVKKTIMPSERVTDEQVISFLAVANNYALDPLKKEIYAFPAKGGGIQAVVSIDGWLTIINSHPEFDGMDLVENYNKDGKFESVTCTIYRKDRTRPTIITEFLDECKRNTDPWSKPKRMLRHKAAIQCARYAFGLSGIVEHDEAEAALAGEREVGPGNVSDLNAMLKADAQVRVIEQVVEEVVVEETATSYPDDQVIEYDWVTEADGEPAPAAPAPVSSSFATVTERINAANSPATLEAAKDFMMAFCELEGNEQFAEELGAAYRWKLSVLKKAQTA